MAEWRGFPRKHNWVNVMIGAKERENRAKDAIFPSSVCVCCFFFLLLLVVFPPALCSNFEWPSWLHISIHSFLFSLKRTSNVCVRVETFSREREKGRREFESLPGNSLSRAMFFSFFLYIRFFVGFIVLKSSLCQDGQRTLPVWQKMCRGEKHLKYRREKEEEEEAIDWSVRLDWGETRWAFSFIDRKALIMSRVQFWSNYKSIIFPIDFFCKKVLGNFILAFGFFPVGACAAPSWLFRRDFFFII